MTGPKIAYQHFCPVARALEVIGEKWSLLIVRDLLGGPRRFSDLRRSLAAITPRWLSLRLRELEEAGVVQRDVAGEREVWYSLTPKGEALAPVVRELVVWGMENAMRPPRPNEAIHPGRALDAFVTYLNQRHVKLSHPALWLLRFEAQGSYVVSFDSGVWSRRHAEDTDSDVTHLVLEMPALDWARLITSGEAERRELVNARCVQGSRTAIEEFVDTLRHRNEVAG